MAFLLAASFGAAGAQEIDQSVFKSRLEGWRAIVDSVEAGLGRDDLSPINLDELRARVDPVRGELEAAIGLFDPRLSDLQKRMQEIGDKPGPDAPPEDPSITQERDQLAARITELDATLKQGRLLKVRADQLADRITSRRRAIFTDTLLASTNSVLDPDLWITAARSIPVELRGIGYLLGDWSAYANIRMRVSGQIALTFGVIAIIIAVVLLRRALRRPLRHFDREPADAPASRLRVVSLAALEAVVGAGAAPLATAASIALLNAFDVLPPRIREISQGLLLAVTIAAVGVALAYAVLAPDRPRRRVLLLAGMNDDIARLLYRHTAAAVWILAAVAFVSTLHRTLVAPLQLTVATNALLALLLVAIAARVLRALGRAEDDEEAPAAANATTAEGNGEEAVVSSALRWIRLPMWILNAGVLGALVAGYVNLASFLASRTLVAVVMAATLYLVIALINAVFIDSLSQGPRAKWAAKTLGVRHGSVELIGVLVAGFLKAVAIIIACIMVVGTWGTSTADLRDFVSRITFGFTIGSSTITLGDVFGALVFLIIGIAVARGIQRWVGAALLPRTALDPGLQNSISTIIGYVGSIAVVAIAMGQLGLNLENIALVAGALSVGIGFGLQSIVSNFVSGLILLAERPIRVGDMILVKGEEGYVRRISVRATEIETFDRAMVLIPNSDLITGMVKNFTHANTTGRVIVPVNVTYDSDPEEVRDILIGCACDHPQVLRSPPPRVFLMKFGDASLQFELRCVVANVDYALTVKSDLHFAVFDRLKAAKIGMPYTPWSIYRGQPIRGIPDLGDEAGDVST
ncbi:DUF3772 domain-containing protein [Bosea sp. 117]|uniref:DUF3772 domain-containing protein n=1 Tax=Bosea sp. 117 TaxID=1125973 RepID=UPI0020C10A2F|nr:DUF3772 domain-containing protein [Bosea sp. 117]